MSSLSVLLLSLVAMLGHGSTTCLGLSAKALSDLEERMAMEQRAQQPIAELMALTSSGQAMCDIMLGVGRGST